MHNRIGTIFYFLFWFFSEKKKIGVASIHTRARRERAMGGMGGIAITRPQDKAIKMVLNGPNLLTH